MLKKILATVVFALAVGAAQAQDKDGDIISVSGFVKGSPKGSTFEVGSRKGQFTVDASRAKVTLDGKKFNPSELTGGSQVTVTGKLRGKKLEATEVRVGNLRGSSNNKPAEKPVGRKPKDTPPVEEPAKEAPKARKPRTRKPSESPVKDAPAKEEPTKSEEPKKKTTRKKKSDSTSKDAPAKDAPKEEPAKDAPKKKTSKKKKSDDKKDEPAKTTGGGN
jgi:cytochrome c-type biogenesis protein CcmE